MRAARFLPLVLLLMTVACSQDGTAAPTPSVSLQQISVAMPTAKLPGLHRRDATLDAVDAAADATHPDALTAILSGAGLVGVRERTYTAPSARSLVS